MRQRAHENGFTLVEVLAALLVFSLSIIGLTHAGTQSAQAISVITEKSLAGIAADNVLVRARLMPLKLGTVKSEQSQMGQDFLVTVTTEKTESPDFYTLTAEVKIEGGTQILISRQAFRTR
jgi:general secretion pathway protein I